MKKIAVWFAFTLLIFGLIPDGFALTFSRHIPVRVPSEKTDIMTRVVAILGSDFLGGLNVEAASIKESECYYYKSEDLLKFYFIIPHPGEILPISSSGRGNPQRLDFDTLKTWFPECPDAVLKQIQKTPSGLEWNEWVESANGCRVKRRTYFLREGSDLIIAGINWKLNPPSSVRAVIPIGPTIVILPPGTEPWRKPPNSKIIPTAQISADRQLAVSFVKELIDRITDSKAISFNDGLRLFHGDGQFMEFQLLRQLGYFDESGARLKPYPDLSCFGMLLKMNKGLFSLGASDTPVVTVTDLPSSGSADGKTSVSAFKVVLSDNQKNDILSTVSNAKHKTIIFDVHVKIFGKEEKGLWVDFQSALINGENLYSLLGFRDENAKEANKRETTIIMPKLFHYPDEKLHELDALMVKPTNEEE